MPKLHTFKLGQYSGKGPRPDLAIIGDHAPANSPFYYFPAMPELACAMNPAWSYVSWREPYVAAEWTASFVGAGTIARTTDKGLLFTSGATDNDNNVLQHLHTFTPAANARAAAYFRVQVSNATELDALLGFWSTDTSPVASEPAEGAYFLKSDDGTILLGRSNDAGGTGSNTASLVAVTVAATDYDLGVVLVPTSGTVGTIQFCYKLASTTVWSRVLKTTDFPDAAVRFSMALQAGDAVARTMNVKRFAYAAYQP